jgi:hypothetical protein
VYGGVSVSFGCAGEVESAVVGAASVLVGGFCGAGGACGSARAADGVLAFLGALVDGFEPLIGPGVCGGCTELGCSWVASGCGGALGEMLGDGGVDGFLCGFFACCDFFGCFIEHGDSPGDL